MADFAAIRFQPSRPLLRELSADRLNSILAEIRRNKPLPGRGITVRQTGQGTAIDLAASIPRGGGTSTPATPQPWDLIARPDPNDENGFLVSVQPGTLNSILPSNWNIAGADGAVDVPCASTGVFYAKARITTDGTEISDLEVVIDDQEPAQQSPTAFGLETSIDILFGLFSQGETKRVIGDGHIIATPQIWLTTDKEPPAAIGQLPYTFFYVLL